ncbi:MAG: hypothetical protein MJY87_12015 [Fibrobacter sp.]|nr:hypothetical protein [Fibrobacter sp.]
MTASLFLSACGDLTAGPVVSDARFSRTFRYYYVTDCRFDRFGLYDCGATQSVSPSYVVRIRVDGMGDATLNLDGESYFFRDGTFSEDWDEFGGYFYFVDGNDELSLYKDGSELIFWDTWNNTATIYSYDLPY